MRQKIAIIGAGIAGLSAASVLSKTCDVTIYDKSRGVGGRMSTRYAGEYEFDHGAQYFTVQDAGFRAVIDAAIEQGAVASWVGRALYLKSGQMIEDTGRDRFVGTPRMNSLPKFLARGQTVKLGQRISRLKRQRDNWQIELENGDVDSGFQAIICAIPPVQAQAILPVEFTELTAVKRAKMQACFALMIGLEKEYDFGWDSLRLNHLPIAWMALNTQKPGRKLEQTCLVVHADALWSEQNQNANLEWVQEQLLAIASEICATDLKTAQHTALHRWLYASVQVHPDQNYLLDPRLKIAVCGDWCAGGRVEEAWKSGNAAALQILN
ncbi:MAG: FAD-dependent oxidoreductase, partial [Litorimonas sp.]